MTKFTQTVPLHKPIWSDDRVWCKFARCENRAGAKKCPMLTGRYCRLTAQAAGLCVFNTPKDSAIWLEAREQLADDVKNGYVVSA